MKPEAKLILCFAIAFTATLIFYDEKPTDNEMLYQEARVAGVLLNTADM